MTRESPSDLQNQRRRAMEAFARADRRELEDGLEDLMARKTWSYLRPPEVGLVMARGRTGGSGAPFNLGELTVTRCAVALEDGGTGHALVMGRDRERTRLAALADAFWQHADSRDAVESRIIEPVLARLQTEDRRVGAETAATKVDFFTLARGED
ncbi:MAG: phosphonate C-P lyase system protein PhnG [Pseudomonadota bacterium]